MKIYLHHEMFQIMVTNSKGIKEKVKAPDTVPRKGRIVAIKRANGSNGFSFIAHCPLIEGL